MGLREESWLERKAWGSFGGQSNSQQLRTSEWPCGQHGAGGRDGRRAERSGDTSPHHFHKTSLPTGGWAPRASDKVVKSARTPAQPSGTFSLWTGPLRPPCPPPPGQWAAGVRLLASKNELRPPPPSIKADFCVPEGHCRNTSLTL